MSRKNVNRTDPELFMTVDKLALLFGMSQRSIRERAKRCNARKEGSKIYAPDIFDCIQREDKDVLKALKKVELEKKRIEVDALKGKYVERNLMETEWAKRAAEYRQSLLALEFKLADQLANRRLSMSHVREIIRGEVLSLLKSMLRSGKYTPQINDVLTVEQTEEAFSQFWDQVAKIKKAVQTIKVKVTGK